MGGKAGMVRGPRRVLLANGKTGWDVGYGWGVYIVPDDLGGGIAIEQISDKPGAKPKLTGKMPTGADVELVSQILVTLSLRKALR